MKKVKLDILAKDIEESNYTRGDDCAITRALGRAGVNAIHDGIGIIQRSLAGNYFATNDDFQEHLEKIRCMYAAVDYKKKSAEGVKDENFFWHWGLRKKEELIEPEDFSFEVELDI